MTVHTTGCIVCGTQLEIVPDFKDAVCAVCGIVERTGTRCQEGHYVCNTCHAGSAVEWIEKSCLQSRATDPASIADWLMKSPLIHMHGPEHHFLVPAALVTSYYHTVGESEAISAALVRVRERAEKVLGGFCGFYGSCGAAIGTGIFFSVITGSTPLSESEWRWANRMTSRALARIADHGGPRCCKRCTFLAILEACQVIDECLGVTLKVEHNIRCSHSDRNKECRTEACPFFPGNDQ